MKNAQRRPLWIVAVILAMPLAMPGQQADNSQQAPPSLKQPNGQQGQPPAQGQNGQAPNGNGQAANSQPAAPAYQPTPDEVKAAQKIQAELDPDQTIQLVQDFEKKYPNSPILTDLYFFAANAYQQKNDVQKSIEYGEKSLKIQPNNLRSLVLLTTLLPQPQDMQGSDQDKDNKLKETETDANKSLQLLQTLQKPATTPDDQFQKLKANVTSEVHSSLGMVHLQRALENLAGPDPAELGKAEAEYKLAVLSPEPNPQDYYRLGEVYERENKADDAIDAFTKSGNLAQGTMIQTLANQQIQQLKAAKAKTAQPPASH
ncbi:MAG TPA: tetratricopeptide repeat protein [Terriglobia bacterium]|nr:tetratricopeptide repeat protein [Terriglobia bacterium]